MLLSARRLTVVTQGMHDAGVLHLDLKGGNIVLRHDPETNHFDPMIADFGCAALTDYDDREDGRWLVGLSVHCDGGR